MAQQNQVSMPGPFGGLVRYDTEYKSKFMLTPTQVLVFVLLIVLLVIAFNLFWSVR